MSYINITRINSQPICSKHIDIVASVFYFSHAWLSLSLLIAVCLPCLAKFTESGIALIEQEDIVYDDRSRDH